MKYVLEGYMEYNDGQHPRGINTLGNPMPIEQLMLVVPELEEIGYIVQITNVEYDTNRRNDR